MTKQITISLAVAKALEAANKTADEVLRHALKVKAEGLTTSGVTFPEGTCFLAWYKDRPYWGIVKDGALIIRDKRFTSTSAAAGEITKRPTNGWDFWQCKFPGKGEFIRISKLRAANGTLDPAGTIQAAVG